MGAFENVMHETAREKGFESIAHYAAHLEGQLEAARQEAAQGLCARAEAAMAARLQRQQEPPQASPAIDQWRVGLIAQIAAQLFVNDNICETDAVIGAIAILDAVIASESRREVSR